MHTSYEKLNVPTNPGKAYRFTERFEILGTEVDGNTGSVGSPLISDVQSFVSVERSCLAVASVRPTFRVLSATS